MKRVNLWFSAGVLALMWCGAASATTYINPTTRKTTLNLSEKVNNPNGFYFTKVGNRDFLGNIQITRSEGAAGSYYYNGTFKDSSTGPGRKIICSGDIAIVRRQVGRSGQLGAEVTWKVKGGQNCTSVGQTFKVNLVELLPRSNASGDYTASNANTWLSETSGSVTWPAWRVTSRDGELNCRQTPNGAIKRVYRANRDTISAELRGGNAIAIANGEPWLLTRQGCYVRANSQYLQPVSLPE
ncbi:hypothetical protein IQ269_20035 [Tychonema sp. LEGE 07199]|uniref:hypothetical protein n=1 Tax=unclassified Tychonema TaxID=2642144 RepID=UPI00187FC9C8|nr:MULTISPECIES: hypothetical protein [unclassified Tychonema]MBE9123025.1 hypothetical protein [Tychonema sp. LEGE 07199]MBE9131346.1 hypothetical protein [Tychonema sp. LEGE 07196]